MKRKITILILGALISNFNTIQGQTKFDAKLVKEDLYFLYQTLDKSHYDLYAQTPKALFDKEFKRIENSITDTLSLIQIDRLFRPFIALTNEGHCSLELPVSSYVSYLQNKGTLFPLDIFFNNNEVLVLENFTADSSIESGDIITSINGSPIDSVVKDCHKYVFGENAYTKNISIESISLPRLYWIINGESKSFTVGINRNNSIEMNVEIPSIPAGEFEAKKARQNIKAIQTRTFYYINNIAYLRPGQFFNLNQQENIQINSKILENRTFFDFLDSCFTSIHESNTNDLIIDLRDNPGGTAIFSNSLVAFFATEPFIGASKFNIRTSKISKEFWESVNDTSQLFKDIKQQILSRKDGERFVIDGAKYKCRPRNDTLKYNGNVFVLINEMTFSQAIEVAGMIKKYGFGTLIGEPTTPLLSANARQFKLPNTQMTVTFPEALYGDTYMINGVFPDYSVQVDNFTEKDEILDYTIEMINEKNEMQK